MPGTKKTSYLSPPSESSVLPRFRLAKRTRNMTGNRKLKNARIRFRQNARWS